MGRRRRWNGIDQSRLAPDPSTSIPFSSSRQFLTGQDILAPGGRFYLVAVQQNKPLEIIEYMRSLGLEAEVSDHYPFFSINSLIRIDGTETSGGS